MEGFGKAKEEEEEEADETVEAKGAGKEVVVGRMEGEEVARRRRRRAELKWFLMALSVRPGRTYCHEGEKREEERGRRKE